MVGPENKSPYVVEFFGGFATSDSGECEICPSVCATANRGLNR
jgi:hypothetical protein